MSKNDVGSLQWGRITGGVLTKEQRRHLRWAIMRDARVFARSRMLLALRKGPRSAGVDPAVMDMPDSSLCHAVEAAAVAGQSPQMLGHAYRSVAYAHAVATMDEVEVDPELLWCACLLHDIALEQPVQDHCFAVRGGETAEQVALDAGAGPATAAILGDAISWHITADLDPVEHPLAYLVAGGALVDVIGKRLEQLDPEFVRAVNRHHPRGDFASVLAVAWRGESSAVKRGRAALAERTAGFSWAARFAPLPG